MTQDITQTAYFEHVTIPSLDKFTNRNQLMLEEALFCGTYLNKPIFPVSDIPGKKTPLVSGGFKAATTDLPTLSLWFEVMHPGAMIGLPTGQVSQIVVLDVDIKKDKNGLNSLQELEQKYGELPNTFTVKTPSGGYHLYFSVAKNIHVPSTSERFGAGLDIRGDGGYVVAAGSINRAWEEYEVIDDLPLAPLPDWLLQLSITKKQKSKNSATNNNYNIQPLQRMSDNTIREALSYIDPDIDYDPWVYIGMALHSADYSVDVWDEWSKGGDKYEAGVCHYKWGTFSASSGITMGSLFSMAREGGWKGQIPQEDEFREIDFISPVNLQDKTIPPRRWILPDWIPVHCTTALYGDGGTGKSLLAMQLMTSAALGKPFLGNAITPVKTLGFFCEDTPDELHRRQAYINTAYGCDFSDLKNMLWHSAVGEDNILMDFSYEQTGKLTQLYNRIEEKSCEFGAQLIVIDTAADTFGGNENVRKQVRQFMGCLNRLALKVDGAVLLCAHPSVAGMASGEGYGGSTAWSNSSRSRLYLKQSSEKDELYNADTRILSRKKANYASKNEDLTIFWRNGVFVTDTDSISDALRQETSRKAEECFLKALSDFEGQGRNLSSARTSANYAPKMAHKSPLTTGFGQKELEAAMERLFSKGLIKDVAYGRGTRPSKKIIKT